jgi:(2Fe-2S) ferredoxin
MPRILDIGVFNAVRESGLAKLMPAIPRITVGMGTCGQGNGAEEVYHALNEAIQNSGHDVMLAGVGCFGSCFQEPVVGIRLPGYPLVLLHSVETSDANRILEAVSSGVMPADLVFCKIEEWTHITAHLRSGQGYRFPSSRDRRRSFCAIAGSSILPTSRSTSPWVATRPSTRS